MPYTRISWYLNAPFPCIEPSLVCFSTTEPLMFQYCNDDLMATDSDISECNAIYQLLEDGTFELEVKPAITTV